MKDSEGEMTTKSFYLVTVGTSAIIAAFDFLLGPEFAVSLFFIFPVIFAGWKRGFGTAASFAIVLCLLRFLCHWAWGFPIYVNPAAVNTALRGISLILLALLTSQLAWKFQKLKMRLHQLETHFPICPACDQIKNENGEWIPLETPVTKDGKFRCLCARCEQKSKKTS